MKKTLIQLANLDEFICKASGKIYLDGSKILTAGAKDELAKRGIGIVYERSAPSVANVKDAGKTCPARTGEQDALESLLISVAALVKKECGMTNPIELREKRIQMVQTIRKSS